MLSLEELCVVLNMIDLLAKNFRYLICTLFNHGLNFFFSFFLIEFSNAGSFGAICSKDVHGKQKCDVKSQYSCILTCVAAGLADVLSTAVCKYEINFINTYCTCNYNC